MRAQVLVVSVLMLAGCELAKPQVDLKDPTNPPNFQADLVECEALSHRGVSIAEGQTWGAVSAGAGAAASAAVVGTNAFTVADAAGGVIGGLIAGGINAERERQNLVTWCLWSRGYTIIGPKAEMTTPRGRCVKTQPGDARERCIEQEKVREVEWRTRFGKPAAIDSSTCPPSP